MDAAGANVDADKEEYWVATDEEEEEVDVIDLADVEDDQQPTRQRLIDSLETLGRPESPNGLTEEAEADLANNNDPNNNAEVEEVGGGLGGVFRASQPRADSIEEADCLIDAAVSTLEREAEEAEEARREQLRRELEEGARTISRVFPEKSFNEIYAFLEAHVSKANRVEVSYLTTLANCNYSMKCWSQNIHNHNGPLKNCQHKNAPKVTN